MDTHWGGVRLGDVIAAAEPADTGRFVLCHALDVYTTNLPLAICRPPFSIAPHQVHFPGHLRYEDGGTAECCVGDRADHARYDDVAPFELCESLKLPPQRLDRLNARRAAARHGAPEEGNGGQDERHHGQSQRVPWPDAR
jgi:hypothetical protein